MFRFVCPMCQHAMEVSESKSGSKTRCQRCGQKLLIPMPPQYSYGKKKAAPRGRRWYARYVVAGVLVLGVAYGAYYVFIAISEASVGQKMEVRNYARNTPERAVRDTIAKNALKPDLVKFEKWGPHLYRREWESMLRLADSSNREAAEKMVKMRSFDCIVRVAYHLPEMAVVQGVVGQFAAGPHDHLFAVKGQYVALIEGIQSGDDWKDRFEQTVLRQSSVGGDSSADKLKSR